MRPLAFAGCAGGSGRDCFFDSITEAVNDFFSETFAGFGVQIPGGFHADCLECCNFFRVLATAKIRTTA